MSEWTKYYEKNKEREKIRKQIYRAKNKDRIREMKHEYYLKNKDDIRERRRDQRKLYNKEQYAKYKDQRMRQHYRLTYGITLEEKEELIKKQGSKCAICGTAEPKGHGTWHIDHCHKTKRIRGILCHHCNVGLGHFKDDVNLLEIAIKYLLTE